MQWIPRQTPLYIGKSEGCRAIHYFLISAIKLWVLVQTASARRLLRRFERVPTINDLRRNKKGIKIYRQNSSHVKNPTEFLTHIFADNATCNLLGRLYQTWVNSMIFCTYVAKIYRIHTRCDILDRIHHMWKIRPNFSHLYLPKI